MNVEFNALSAKLRTKQLLSGQNLFSTSLCNIWHDNEDWACDLIYVNMIK